MPSLLNAPPLHFTLRDTFAPFFVCRSIRATFSNQTKRQFAEPLQTQLS